MDIIATGFISTLATTEVGWRIAMRQAKREKMTSGGKFIAMKL
ncbi:MAG: hypothetical protein WAK17_29960 [Candidatus Nitrosopolaris sp.]